MSVRISHTAQPGKPGVKRWYAWLRTPRGFRKIRLSLYLKQLRTQNRNSQAEALVKSATKKGYKHDDNAKRHRC